MPRPWQWSFLASWQTGQTRTILWNFETFNPIPFLSSSELLIFFLNFQAVIFLILFIYLFIYLFIHLCINETGSYCICSPGWLWTYYVAQAGFELTILLLLPLEELDYRSFWVGLLFLLIMDTYWILIYFLFLSCVC
jgi:hypothetical protein